MYHEILRDKTMESRGNALRAALAADPRPYQITIDNEIEFVGTTFQQILAESETLDHRTHPYSPEENGKIERFWETLEATIDYSQSYSLIDDVIHEYNEIWPDGLSSGLQMKRGAGRGWTIDGTIGARRSTEAKRR
jgi:transposase InsO family protein